MQLTSLQMSVLIGAVALGAMLTRFLPFLLFPEHKTVPSYILYLGHVLPPACIGLLVVYCYKNVSLWESPWGIPEGIATIFILLLHHLKHNVLLSIAGGTAVYMLLLHLL
ncbi:MAG: AzlD domain-containing protein [Lachnospiraceae bacterium]